MLQSDTVLASRTKKDGDLLWQYWLALRIDWDLGSKDCPGSEGLENNIVLLFLLIEKKLLFYDENHSVQLITETS